LVLLGVATVAGAVGGELPQGGELGLGEIQFSQDEKDPVALA
jgi:hypothetical protein